MRPYIHVDLRILVHKSVKSLARYTQGLQMYGAVIVRLCMVKEIQRCSELGVRPGWIVRSPP